MRKINENEFISVPIPYINNEEKQFITFVSGPIKSIRSQIEKLELDINERGGRILLKPDIEKTVSKKDYNLNKRKND